MKIRGKNDSIQNENGFTLIEVLASIVLLGLTFILIVHFITQNSLMISMNQQKEEAISIREDIKEWLTYKSQIQDVANFNQVVLTNARISSTLDEATKIRMKHFIIDNSGIQRDPTTGASLYNEIMVDTSGTNRGDFIRKIEYDHSGDHLPSKLASNESNKFYIGTYLDQQENPTDFLVELVVKTKSNDIKYDPRTDGIALTIKVYDKKKGSLLTETLMNWFAES